MRRSLYWKFSVTFVAGVIVSIITSYLITSLFIQEEVIFERELEETSSYFEGLLKLVDFESVPELLELSSQYGVELVLLDQNGQPIYEEMNVDFITTEMIERLQSLAENEVISFTPKRGKAVRYLGMGVANIKDADFLFLKMDRTDALADTRRLTLQSLLLVLVVGSLFIMLISRYFVD